MFNYFDQGHRLDYGSLLYPEYGYKLSFAIGCTYSLDFEALLSVPIYLGAVEQPGSEILDNPFLVLESIRRSTDKIALFCNCDGIRMMRNVQPVFALLENSVFPVSLGSGKNFHPKMWVIKYVSHNNGPDIIKVIILSRNLTFDRSLDLAVVLKGMVRGRSKRHSKHQPIVDLLNYLVTTCDVKDKAEKIQEIADDLLRIESFEISKEFDDYDFYITGIPNHDSDSKEICSSCRRMMIISPFLNESVVSSMVKDCSWRSRNKTLNRVLISRINSITPLIFNLFDEVYVPVEGLEDNTILQEVDDLPKRDLHAKVVFKETYSENLIYIGSFNATSNARDKNVEIMVKLRYKKGLASLKCIKEQFVDVKPAAFQRLLTIPNEETTDDSEEMMDFSDIISSVKDAKVKLDDNGSYSIIIHFISDDPNAYILPLFLNGKGRFLEISPEIVFEHMTLRELSELFIVKKKDEMRIIKIHIDDMPIEERNDAIISSIIDSKPKFLQYVLFLLSDEPELATLEISKINKDRVNDKNINIITPSIYERMLLALAREPGKIEAIRDIISHVEADKVDEEFIQLVKYFERFLGE